jgi:hypothetical protein
MIGAIAAAASLGAAAVVTGGIGMIGALIMLLFVAEPLPVSERSARARAPS